MNEIVLPREAPRELLAGSGDPLPATLAARVTFVIALALTSLVAALGVVQPVSLLWLYGSLVVVAGVVSFAPGIPERARAACVTTSWLLAGLGTLWSDGLSGGLAILVVAVALIGLLHTRAVAVAAAIVSTAAMVVAGIPRVASREDAARLAAHAGTFFGISVMTTLVQSAVVRKANLATERARNLAIAVECTESSVIMSGVDGRITWVNEAFSRLTGFARVDAVGRKPSELLQGPATSPASRAYMRDRLRSGEPFACEVINYTKSREPYFTAIELQPLRDDAGVLRGFTALQTDVTLARMRSELDTVDRELTTALAAARTADDGLRALVEKLVEAPPVLVARAWRVFDGNTTLVASARTRSSHVSPEAIDEVFAGSSPPAVQRGSSVTFESRRSAGFAHSVLRRGLAGDRPWVIEVCVADEVPGRAELAERLPRLMATLSQFLRRLDENERFEAIFEHSPDALIVVDDAGRVQQRNAVAASYFRELAPGSEAASVVHQLAAPLGSLRAADVHRVAGAATNASWRIGAESAASIEVEATFAPIPLAAGQCVLVAVRDVTARRQAEHALEAALVAASRALAEREVLLKEIHHRVKNNLQIVASLLGMQADRSRTEEAQSVLVESEHRIRSMALIHSMLYGGSDLAHVDIAEYATALASELRSALDTGAELSFSVESVELSVDQAIPCGLILNELITNALKHGRSADGRCRLRVEVGLRDRALVLTISDSGPGLPADYDARRKGSLGMKIIDALVRQLGATISVERTGGARFVLAMPIAESVLPPLVAPVARTASAS